MCLNFDTPSFFVLPSPFLLNFLENICVYAKNVVILWANLNIN